MASFYAKSGPFPDNLALNTVEILLKLDFMLWIHSGFLWGRITAVEQQLNEG